MPTFAPGVPDSELFHAEDGLITMYDLRKAAGMDTTDIESTYQVLAKEMFSRGLLTQGLIKQRGQVPGPDNQTGLPPEFGDNKPRKAGDNEPDWDGDNDDQPGAMNNTGQGVGPSEAHGGTEQQQPKNKVKQGEGPVVRKEDGPPNAGKHPKMDDGIHTTRGTKSGKGGETNRFQVHSQSGTAPGQEDGDPDNTGHDNTVPNGKAKQNKSPDGGNRTVAKSAEGIEVFFKDWDAASRREAAANGEALPDGSFPIRSTGDLSDAVHLYKTGHQGSDPGKTKSHIQARAKALGEADPFTPQPMGKEFAFAFTKAYEAGLDESTALEVIQAATAPTFEQYAVLKAAESRYVLGPVYMPEQYDAHGEWTTADHLQKALWEYVRETGADRRIYLQHSAQPAGEWMEVMQWPYTVNATMQKSIDGVQKSISTQFPAGTIYMGTVWEPWAWEMVKSGRITGFSMGGWAKRLEAEINARGKS